MSDFTVRSDSVNVEQIMEQIRARIREKRGVDYTEQEIRDLAAVKLEKFLDPKLVRSDLLQEFQRSQAERPVPTSFTFEDFTLFDSPRPIVRRIRRLLRPVLKLFFNPDPLIQALHIQAHLNEIRPRADHLYYELLHNLVVETTRLSIEVKNLKMRIESLTGRLEFNERRARALESVVVYQPAHDDARSPAPAPARQQTHTQASSAAPSSAGPGPSQDVTAPAEGPGQRSRRRRRRRGRRGGGSAAAIMGAPAATDGSAPSNVAGPEQGGSFSDEPAGFDEGGADESGTPPSLEEGSDDES